MLSHHLKCDPRKVQWCSICKTHSTTSDIEMKRHQNNKHPGYKKLTQIFDTKKCVSKSNSSSIKALTIKWENYDIDTLFNHPDVFKQLEDEDNNNIEELNYCDHIE